jgi:6-phosphogluconolactonase
MTQTHHLLLACGYAEADEPGLHGFYLLEASGALVPNGTLPGIAQPSFLAVHSAGDLYVASETEAGCVVGLRLGQRPGAADELGRQPAGGDWPCHLAFDPFGRWLAVANYGSGSARLIPRLSDGRLGAPGPLVQHSGSGPHPERQTGPHAHSTVFSPDGRYAIVADLGIDRLMLYRVNATTDALALHGEAVARPGAGPRHMAWHPSGRLLYVANELDNTVSLFGFDPDAGTLVETAQHTTLPPGAPHNQVADLQLDSNNGRLYVSNRGHNSIAVFAVDPVGQLALLAIRSCGGDWPRTIALSPGGRFLVVANQQSDELAVLPTLPGSEALGEPVSRARVKGAACVVFPQTANGWLA